MMITSSKCRPRNSAVRFWLTLHATRSAYGRFATDPSFGRVGRCHQKLASLFRVSAFPMVLSRAGRDCAAECRSYLLAVSGVFVAHQCRHCHVYRPVDAFSAGYRCAISQSFSSTKTRGDELCPVPMAADF